MSIKRRNAQYSGLSVEQLESMLDTWKRLRERMQQDDARISVSPTSKYSARARYGDMGLLTRDRDMQRIDSTINEIEQAIADKKAEQERQPE